MALPNFMIVGAPKAATTTLASLLSDHPEVFVSRKKELHFFVAAIHRAAGNGISASSKVRKLILRSAKQLRIMR